MPSTCGAGEGGGGRAFAGWLPWLLLALPAGALAGGPVVTSAAVQAARTRADAEAAASRPP